MRQGQNWLQLVRYCSVGVIGYSLNVSVFAVCVEWLHIHHVVAATIAFGFAVTNNFLWNRRWTFAADGHAGFQAMRFFAVSMAAFLLGVGVLQLLIDVGGVPAVPAQAVAIVIPTPLSFLSNKVWTFGATAPAPAEAATAAADASTG
jgi:dolichol-phosphate mannosyltransferase